jgi:hypothetical protein
LRKPSIHRRYCALDITGTDVLFAGESDTVGGVQ